MTLPSRVWARVLPKPGSGYKQPAYAVVGEFAVSNRGPQLSGLRFDPWSKVPWPPPLLTVATIRSAPVEQLYEQMRGFMDISQSIGFNFDIDLGEFARNPRPGRRGRPDVFYARLASEYVELLRTSSTPTKDLSEMHNYSATSMRDFLNQARAHGLLTRPQRGQAGGQLTEDALKLLAEHGKDA